MLNQNDVREKIQVLKGGVKNLLSKFHAKSDGQSTDQADGVVDADGGEIFNARNDMHEYNPDVIVTQEAVGTASRNGVVASTGAQNQVWDNEDASMQDKSYSFDEETTDADYEVEDSMNFQDDTDSGQENRYS